MVWAYHNVQVAEYGASQCVFRQHAANRIFHHSKRLAVHLFTSRTLALSTGISSITNVFFRFPLVSGQNNLLRIDDNDIVAAVSVRREIRLVLAAKALCDLRGYAAQSLAFSINEQPLFVSILLIGRDCLVAQSIHGECIECTISPQNWGCEDSKRMFTTQAQVWTKNNALEICPPLLSWRGRQLLNISFRIDGLRRVIPLWKGLNPGPFARRMDQKQCFSLGRNSKLK